MITLQKLASLNMSRRDPATTQALLIGAGISSLSAAVHLIHDCHLPASNIRIFDSADAPGGCLSNHKVRREEEGYIVRAARKIRGTYYCLEDMLGKVPSPDARRARREALDEVEVTEEANKEKLETRESLGEYIKNRNTKTTDSGPCTVRIAATTAAGPTPVDLTHLGLSSPHQVSLMRFMMCPEATFAGTEVQAHFEPEFFETNFWDLWSSTYVFHPWHGAIEFQRYLKRFLHEVPRLRRMEGMEYTAMNDAEAIVGPIVDWLVEEGVQFVTRTAVEDVEFELYGDDQFMATAIITAQGQPDGSKVQQRHCLAESDILLVTLGSVASGLTIGNNHKPPITRTSNGTLTEWGPAWSFWGQLISSCPHPTALGNPWTFCTNISRSSWLAFTTTTYDSRFVDAVVGFCKSENGTCPLLTFRDCPWMLTISVPRQPYFANQSAGTRVIWGYGLFPDQEGMFVKKRMDRCTGREIFKELLGHMGMANDDVLNKSVTIPIMMPLTGSPLLTKEPGDRPDVVPKQSRNLGLLGQFVEMERDVAFTLEYSARSAQVAVYQLMGLETKPPAVHGEDPSVQVLGEFMKAMMT